MGRRYRPLGQGLAAAGLRRPLRHGLRRARRLRPRAARAPRRPSWSRSPPAPSSSRQRLDTRLLAAPRLGRRLPRARAPLDRRGPGGEPLRLPAPARRGRRLARPPEALAGDDAARPRRHAVPLRGLVRRSLPPGAVRGRGRRPRRAHALFAVGTARKDRSAGTPRSLLGAALGLSQLGVGADRPEVLLVLSLGLAFAALRAATALGGTWPSSARRRWPRLSPRGRSRTTARRASASPPRGSWAARCSWRSRAGGCPSRGGPARAGRRGRRRASVALAARTDRPAALLALLAAQALLAAVTARRWAWTTRRRRVARRPRGPRVVRPFLPARARRRGRSPSASRWRGCTSHPGGRGLRHGPRARRAGRGGARRGRGPRVDDRSIGCWTPCAAGSPGPGGGPLWRPSTCALGLAARQRGKDAPAGPRDPRPGRRLPHPRHPRPARPARHHARLGGGGRPARCGSASASARRSRGPSATVSWPWRWAASSSATCPCTPCPSRPSSTRRSGPGWR